MRQAQIKFMDLNAESCDAISIYIICAQTRRRTLLCGDDFSRQTKKKKYIFYKRTSKCVYS